MNVVIDGIKYVPISDVMLRPPSGKHPSDMCRNCGSENYRTSDSRNKGGYRIRTKECLDCGCKWKTIEYALLPVGRPKNL